MSKKEWVIIGTLGTAVTIVFSCLGCLMLSMLTPQSRPTSPTAAAEITITATLKASATQTNTSSPPSTPTPVPTPTHTLQPTETPRPTATSTPISGRPVSQHYAPLSTQVRGGDSILTLHRVEFWQEVGATKAENGMFIVLIGELASATGKEDCPKANNFILDIQGKKYETSSSMMTKFKPVYGWDYPGAIRGQCVIVAEPTYLVFDVPFELGPSRLVFRDASTDLGDLRVAFQKSKMPTPTPIPTPTLRDRVRIIAEQALRATSESRVSRAGYSVPRIQEIEIVNIPLSSDINIFVTWTISEGWTSGMTRFAARKEATDLFKALYTSGLSINQVVVRGTFSMKDKYGNISEETVVRLVLDKATARRINWEYFSSDNIYEVAKVLYLHPEFRDK